MRGFKYDVVQLLSAIHERPVIWDRTLEIYKDKIERKNAWEEICNIMDEKYEQMSWEEKRATVEHIVNKWTNIRDTFVKSVKNKMGKPKKKYMLYKYLKFLLKVVPEAETNEEYYSSEETSTVYMKQELVEEAGTSSSFPSSRKKKKEDSEECEEYIPKKSKRERQTRNSEDSVPDSDYATFDTGNIDFVEVGDSKEESDPRIMNEDEAFFASLLPTVVRYNEDERLEFRIQVLAVMKNIKQKRKW